MEIKDSEFENGDFSLVELKGSHRLTPHCKIHGAMNKVSKNIWRCITTYEAGSNDQLIKERACDACCVEVTLPEE